MGGGHSSLKSTGGFARASSVGLDLWRIVSSLVWNMRAVSMSVIRPVMFVPMAASPICAMMDSTYSWLNLSAAELIAISASFAKASGEPSSLGAWRT